jgi:collagen beta-1,O-galactosyltransferase
MINLARREDRRIKMENIFRELGLVAETYAAVDGKLLTDDNLKEQGIEFLPGYYDPYHKRPMTMGEIGCFLSHYYIWENVSHRFFASIFLFYIHVLFFQIVEHQLKEVLVLEDDIKFEHYFNEQAKRLLDEARKIGGWDLIYFGRKRLQETDEPWVKGSDYMVKAGYSYWTLGYLITLEGAKKLIAANPLKMMLPVDEFLPIMFDKHPNATWKSFYPERNLQAWSAAPLLLFPTHYTGEEGYISDTEDSLLVEVPQFDIDLEIGENVHKKSDRGKMYKDNQHLGKPTLTHDQDIFTDFAEFNVKEEL